MGVTGGTASAEIPGFSLEDLANLFSTYFPKIEGALTGIDRDHATVNIGLNSGLVKGVVLELFRDGEPFYHPVTHEEMGKYEVKIGSIEMDQIDENSGTGLLRISGNSPRIGDKVRISSARIPVKVTGDPDKKNLIFIDEFSRYLIETDRFTIPAFHKAELPEAQPGTLPEPVYEFKVVPVNERQIHIDLISLPYQHQIDQLEGATTGVLQ